jgi:hypothetical protein
VKLLDRLKADHAYIQKTLDYVKARLGEKSTLGGICAAIAAGAVVPAPYSYIIIAFGVIAVFYPETPKK